MSIIFTGLRTTNHLLKAESLLFTAEEAKQKDQNRARELFLEADAYLDKHIEFLKNACLTDDMHQCIWRYCSWRESKAKDLNIPFNRPYFSKTQDANRQPDTTRAGYKNHTSSQTPESHQREEESESEKIKYQLNKSLRGLVGLEKLIDLFSIDLEDFYAGSQSKGKIFWGDHSCGKTELAQRVTGMKDGYPGFTYKNNKAYYLSGVDSGIDVKQIIDSLPDNSILFIDEADKALVPSAKMVSEAESIQLQHSVITHFERKKIYWIFLGTFKCVRGLNAITKSSLSSALEPELTTRLDYADWQFPKWNIETLLRAVRGSCQRRGLHYDDGALELIVSHCLKSGGGVREFDSIDSAILRRIKLFGLPPIVNLELANSIIHEHA